MECPDADIPDYLSGDILQFIEVQSFNASDTKPFNPHNNLSTELDNFCVNNSEGYLIPLFLIIQTGKKKGQMSLRFKVITNLIADYIKMKLRDILQL